jgi:hypothetical protein
MTERTESNSVEKSMELASDFYNGAGALQMLSAWGRVMANPDAIREFVMKFESSFVELGRLQDEGKLYPVNVLASTETLEAIRRLNDLIKLGLDCPQTLQRASEIHALAEKCLNAIKSDPATEATIRARETPLP